MSETHSPVAVAASREKPVQLDMSAPVMAFYKLSGETGVGSVLADGSLRDVSFQGIVTGFTLEDYAAIHMLPKKLLQRMWGVSTVLYQGKFAVWIPRLQANGKGRLRLTDEREGMIPATREDFIPAICVDDLVGE